MKQFESTDTLMELLESGDYKRPVMKCDGETFEPEKMSGENVCENTSEFLR